MVNCEAYIIKMRAKNCIGQIRKDHPNNLLLVSAIIQSSHKCNAWIGGRHPNYCIDANQYGQEELVTNEMVAQIKVGLHSS